MALSSPFIITKRTLTTTTTTTTNNLPQKIRIAIIGGGAAGLSTALHLSSLLNTSSSSIIETPIDVYESTSNPPSQNKQPQLLIHENNPGSGAYGRNIGVGIWSTALSSFQNNNHHHSTLLDELINHGQWVTSVGYRTSNGDWLARSRLGDGLLSQKQRRPALLFLKEDFFLEQLRRAVGEDERICVHYGTKEEGGRVVTALHRLSYATTLDGIGTAHLRMESRHDTTTTTTTSSSARDYHLIVDASGTYSTLRQKYATKHHRGPPIEHRGYTVFRGHSSQNLPDDDDDGTAFQTWGDDRGMRFAAVPRKNNGGCDWFATTNREKEFSNWEGGMEERRRWLEGEFGTWHEPIPALIGSTASDDMLIDRAVAHSNGTVPILSFHESTMGKINKMVDGDEGDISTLERRREMRHADDVEGFGPMLTFVGDANMTIDPLLAQGFTMAMDDAKSLADAVAASASSSAAEEGGIDAERLRRTVKDTYENVRLPRIVACLRTTELVQALAQPTSGGSVMGWVNRVLVRPVVKVVPDFVKTPVFDAMVRYSLGMRK